MDRWLEINLNSISYNLNKIKEYLNDKKIIAVVKGNAYGNGIIEVAKHIENKVDYIAVGLEYEAIKLRKEGIKSPILILSPYFNPTNIIKYDLTPTIDNISVLLPLSIEASKSNKIVNFHLKINTGMNRFGLSIEDISVFFDEYKKLTNLNIEGIYSHFAISIDRNKKFVYKQMRVFQDALNITKKYDIEAEYIHMENSTSSITINSKMFNTVRIGNALYGKINNPNLKLKNVSMVKAKILEIKSIKKGQLVGYGLAYKCKKDTRVGIIPIGFSDGFEVIRETKSYSFKEVLINIIKTFYRFLKPRNSIYFNNFPLRTVGKTNMQFTLVDLTNFKEINVGDVLTVNVPTFYISSDIPRIYIGTEDRE